MPGPPNFLDSIADDLSLWIDDTADQVATSFAPGRAPFSANISEEAKLEYYRARLFNPDGSPNAAGRDAELQRLGPQGFRQVYMAVINRYPELRIPTPPEISVPEQWPAVPRGLAPGPPGMQGGPPPPPPSPGPPMMPPRIPAMASGGIVTKPTIALIGEAGPEAVVPLDQLPQYQLPAQPDPDLSAHLGNAPGPDVTPPTPNADEIRAYIWQAAQQRGIDPNVALRVAQHEGTNPQTGQFDSPAQQGTFDTGRSWWPFQLHYGGKGTPYEQWGNVAGMGNDFTQQTGWQPGDPRAWKDATDFALDQAVANPSGWALWYGSGPAKVAPRQGLPPMRSAR